MRNAKVLAALSGGVDSSVAAGLAVQAGAQVVGVTMLLYGGPRQGSSCSTADATAAQEAADALGVELRVVDHTAEFERRVMVPFADQARRGLTGNPCLMCNKEFKLDWLFSYAQREGFDVVVTGHHARVVSHGGLPWLARSVNDRKDQSYVLHAVSAAQLRLLSLPLGGFGDKDKVRAVAAQMGLPAAARPDSMELCFSRAAAVGELTSAPVVDADGREVGRTDAAELVTLGQRRGLCPGVPDGQAAVGFSPDRRVVQLARKEDLVCSRVRLADVRFTHARPVRVFGQCSAHGPLLPASLDGDEVVWDVPQRRVAPGQTVVLYVGSPHGPLVAGGGVVV